MVFSKGQHPCSHGVDVLKAHHEDINLAQDSNTTPLPFILGFAWA